jgi:hypothetical protein
MADIWTRFKNVKIFNGKLLKFIANYWWNSIALKYTKTLAHKVASINKWNIMLLLLNNIHKIYRRDDLWQMTSHLFKRICQSLMFTHLPNHQRSDNTPLTSILFLYIRKKNSSFFVKLQFYMFNYCSKMKKKKCWIIIMSFIDIHCIINHKCILIVILYMYMYFFTFFMQMELKNYQILHKYRWC